MSSKIEASRETLENILKDGASDPVVYASYRQAAADIRALLAAAVVERQPIEGVDLNDCVYGSHPEFGQGYFFTPDAIKEFYTPYQLTELQATIDQQAIEIGRVSASWHGMKRDLDNAKAEIERLKGGQGEAAYYQIETPRKTVNGVVTEWFPAITFYSGEQLKTVGEHRIVGRLYTSPPAPVSVVQFANDLIDGAFEGGNFGGDDIQDIAVKYGLLRIETREKACGETCACREYGFPTECYRKTACLDKVKELNQ